MASYLQWKRLFEEEDDFKRAYMVYGPDRALCNEVVSSIRGRVVERGEPLVRSVSVADEGVRPVWDALNSYGLHDGVCSLTLVHEAELITNWEPYMEWVMNRHMPHSHAILIFGQREIDTTTPHVVRTVKSGRLVKCGPLNEEDMCTYIQQRRPGTPNDVCRHVVSRASNNMRSIHNLLLKVALFEGQLTSEVVDTLLDVRSDDDFVAAMTATNKPRALRSIEHIHEDEVSGTIGLLDLRLHQMATLYGYQKKNAHIRDVIMGTQLPSFLVLELLPHARYYDRRAVAARYHALSVADHAWQGGARQGVLEALVRLW